MGKENLTGWWGIDTSIEVATGEPTDDSNFNFIMWYQWAILKAIAVWWSMHIYHIRKNIVQAFWKVTSFIMIYSY